MPRKTTLTMLAALMLMLVLTAPGCIELALDQSPDQVQSKPAVQKMAGTLLAKDSADGYWVMAAGYDAKNQEFLVDQDALYINGQYAPPGCQMAWHENDGFFTLTEPASQGWIDDAQTWYALSADDGMDRSYDAAFGWQHPAEVLNPGSSFELYAKGEVDNVQWKDGTPPMGTPALAQTFKIEYGTGKHSAMSAAIKGMKPTANGDLTNLNLKPIIVVDLEGETVPDEASGYGVFWWEGGKTSDHKGYKSASAVPELEITNVNNVQVPPGGSQNDTLVVVYSLYDCVQGGLDGFSSDAGGSWVSTVYVYKWVAK